MRPRYLACLALATLSLAMLVACGGDSNPTQPGGGGGPGQGPGISARIDGASWRADDNSIFVGNSTLPGQLSFQGLSLTPPVYGVNVTVSRVHGEGVYPLGVNQFSASGGIGIVTGDGVNATTPLNGDAGVMTITSLTDSRVAGTFSFVAVPTAGGDPVSVTEGQFDVPLSAGFVAVAYDQRGSMATATLGDVPWSAATVGGIGGPGVSIVLTASNDETTLTFSLGPFDGPNSGPLSVETPPLRRITAVTIDAGSWGGTAADTGTIEITELTATRVAGIFAATLASTSGDGQGPPLVISGGEFDVRLGE